MYTKPGSKLLKVMSVIMLVIAAINMLSVFGILMAMWNLAKEHQLTGGVTLGAALAMLAIAGMILAGNAGWRNWNKPENVKTCWIFGLINLGTNLVLRIANIILEPTSQQILGAVLGLIIPGLFLLGVYQLSKLPVTGDEIVDGPWQGYAYDDDDVVEAEYTATEEEE